MVSVSISSEFSAVARGIHLALQVTMLPLSKEQLALLAEKLCDAANLAAGTLIFGQFLSEHPFSLTLALSGVGLWLFMTAIAVVFVRRSEGS